MSKRTIILSNKQINEIVGEEWDVNADCESDGTKENGSEEVLAASNLSNGMYSKSVTTDDISDDLSNDGLYNMYRFGGPTAGVLSYTLTEWKKKRLNETNSDLKNRKTTFSPTAKKNMNRGRGGSVADKAINGEDISDDRFADICHDFKEAERKAQEEGDDTTLNNMGGEEAAKMYREKYEQLKNQSSMRRNANVQKREKHSRETGNGESALPKGETITWF